MKTAVEFSTAVFFHYQGGEPLWTQTREYTLLMPHPRRCGITEKIRKQEEISLC